MEEKNYDVVILGAGPSGMNAAIYAVRAGLSTLIIEKGAFGGQIVDTYEIKNYLGFESVGGFELAEKMRQQVLGLGAEIISDIPESLDLDDDIKKVKTISGKTFRSKSLILSMGAASRKLGIENEDELRGKGVSYCAICDGAFFKDQTVAIAGGGNTALEDALYLNKIAKKVYLIHRRDKFRADQITIDDLNKTLKSSDNKIEVVFDSEVKRINGMSKLESILVHNKKTDTSKEYEINGLFIAVGRIPSSKIVKNKISMTEDGYIKADNKMHTNIQGVFVAGDIRETEIRQIITAAADGAVAATNASNYIRKKFN